MPAGDQVHIGPVVLELWYASQSPRGLVEALNAGSHPRVPHPAGLREAEELAFQTSSQGCCCSHILHFENH